MLLDIETLSESAERLNLVMVLIAFQFFPLTRFSLFIGTDWFEWMSFIDLFHDQFNSIKLSCSKLGKWVLFSNPIKRSL